MGGFLPGPPPPPGGNPSPDIPVTDFVAQGKETAAGMKEAGFFGDLWARFWGYFVLGWRVMVETIVSIMDAWISDVVSIFSTAQGTNTTGFFALVGSLLEDLLGVGVDAQAISDTFHKRGKLASIRAVGGTVYDNLAAEFNSGGQVTPESGEAAAKAFMGFLIEFAVRQGNVSFLQSLFPFQWLEGIREYGEVMAGNLGLGRLARRAFQPLVTTLIADPLQWQLNRKYRPKILTPAEAIRAFNRTLITSDRFQQEMSYAGYTDERIAALQQESLTQLAAAETYTLFKWGLIDADTAKGLLLRFGYDSGVADRVQAAEAAKEADPHIAQLLSVIRTQRVSGFIDAATFRGIVDALPLGKEAHDRFLNVVGQEVEKPRRRLTLAQMQTAFDEGIISLSDLDDYLKLEGYGDDDRQLLALLTLAKLSSEQAKQQYAQARYDRAKQKALAKGQLPPPAPPGVTP